MSCRCHHRYCSLQVNLAHRARSDSPLNLIHQSANKERLATTIVNRKNYPTSTNLKLLTEINYEYIDLISRFPLPQISFDFVSACRSFASMLDIVVESL